MTNEQNPWQGMDTSEHHSHRRQVDDTPAPPADDAPKCPNCGAPIPYGFVPNMCEPCYYGTLEDTTPVPTVDDAPECSDCGELMKTKSIANPDGTYSRVEYCMCQQRRVCGNPGCVNRIDNDWARVCQSCGDDAYDTELAREEAQEWVDGLNARAHGALIADVYSRHDRTRNNLCLACSGSRDNDTNFCNECQATTEDDAPACKRCQDTGEYDGVGLNVGKTMICNCKAGDNVARSQLERAYQDDLAAQQELHRVL